MKIFITFLCMIVSLNVVTAAKAAVTDTTSVLVYTFIDGKTHAMSMYGDFIIFNNTNYQFSLTSDGWAHPGIGSSLQPNTVVADTDCDLTETANASGTLILSNAKSGFLVGIYSKQYVDSKGEITTWWYLGMPSSSYPFPPATITNNSINQFTDANFVYTLVANANIDGKDQSQFSGNSKIIFIISDRNAQDFGGLPIKPTDTIP